MVAPERFNSSQVPRNIDNLYDYVNNLSDENYERYEEWRIENRDNFVREYNDLLNEHHMLHTMNSSDEEDSDEEDSELDSDEEDSQMDSDNESEGSEEIDFDEENTIVDSEDEYDVARQSAIEEPQPEDDSDSEIEYSVVSDEDSDYDSDEELDADYTEWLYPYLSSSHVLL